MLPNRQGITKLNDVFSMRQKAEILDVFNKHGELCLSTLLKKGKDENKEFQNNSSLMGLVSDLIISNQIVESSIRPCPYTGKMSQYWQTVEKSLEPIEELQTSFKNVLVYMKEREIFTLSQDELQRLII